MSTRTKLLPKLDFTLYRMATIAKSFKTLYTLPKEKVDAFMQSYNIYDHDWENEEHLIREMGANYYCEVKRKLADYYSVLNHLCALGQVEKMYIPPAMDLSKGIIKNQLLFEKKLAKDLGVGKGDEVLDIGCGRGRVACHIATETGASVTGLNIDENQLHSARRFAQSNLSLCQFLHGDLNDLPLPFKDNSFDAVYQVQAFSLSKDLGKTFKDLHRILKSGAKLACLDWMSLPAYDPNNMHHVSLMKKVKPLIGAIGTVSVDRYTDLLKQAGFQILISENPSVDGLQAPLIEKADNFYRHLGTILKILVSCRVLPKHFRILFDRFTKDGEALIEADRLRLATMVHYVLAQKK